MRSVLAIVFCIAISTGCGNIPTVNQSPSRTVEACPGVPPDGTDAIVTLFQLALQSGATPLDLLEGAPDLCEEIYVRNAAPFCDTGACAAPVEIANQCVACVTVLVAEAVEAR
jgi:hypothetical protein